MTKPTLIIMDDLDDATVTPEEQANLLRWYREVQPSLKGVPMYYLVNTDNFGGDYPNEAYLKANCATSIHELETTKDIQEAQPYALKGAAQGVADRINNQLGEHHHRYYKVVNQDYKLQPGFEP